METFRYQLQYEVYDCSSISNADNVSPDVSYIILTSIFCHSKESQTSPKTVPTYSAAQIYANYAYAYYTSIFCVYAYVNTRTYTHIYAHICAYMSLCYAFPQVSLC